MSNQERAELAFEYFMEHGDVTIGDIKHGADTLTREDVLNELDYESFLLDAVSSDIKFSDLANSVKAFNVIFDAKAFGMILKLIDKHYED